MASSGTYFGTPALYGVMKKVEMPEVDDRSVDMAGVGEMPTIGGLQAWIAVNAFGTLLAGRAAPLDNVMPSNLSRIERDEHNALLKAKSFAMEVALRHTKYIQKKKDDELANQQIARQRAIATMCRIYVGAIHYEIGESTVKTAFESFGPVRSVDMIYDINTGRHKGFAFVEFETPEAANMAIQDMQAAIVGGRAVKVGRPSNMGQAEHFITQFAQEAARYNRVYVANIHKKLSDDEIKSIFESYGRVLSCSLVRDPNDPENHCGYGYLEYEAPEPMEEAAKVMNGFDLGGQLLRVSVCITPPSIQNVTTSNFKAVKDENKLNPARMLSEMIKRNEAAKRAGELGLEWDPEKYEAAKAQPQKYKISAGADKGIAGVTVGSKTQSETTLKDAEADLSVAGIEQRHMLMQRLSRAPTTRVMVLRNMLSADEIDGEVEAEVTEECENYGTVRKVVIYQERQSAAEDAEVVVKIFVEFSMPQDVQTAISALNGRYFGGRIVSATIYDQTAFDIKDYTG